MYAFGETIIRVLVAHGGAFRKPNDRTGETRCIIYPGIYMYIYVYSICRPVWANLLITSDLRLFPLHILYTMLYAYLMNISVRSSKRRLGTTIPIIQVTACKHNLPPLSVMNVYTRIIDPVVDTVGRHQNFGRGSYQPQTRYHSCVRGSLMERLWMGGGRGIKLSRWKEGYHKWNREKEMMRRMDN